MHKHYITHLHLIISNFKYLSQCNLSGLVWWSRLTCVGWCMDPVPSELACIWIASHLSGLVYWSGAACCLTWQTCTWTECHLSGLVCGSSATYVGLCIDHLPLKSICTDQEPPEWFCVIGCQRDTAEDSVFKWHVCVTGKWLMLTVCPAFGVFHPSCLSHPCSSWVEPVAILIYIA